MLKERERKRERYDRPVKILPIEPFPRKSIRSTREVKPIELSPEMKEKYIREKMEKMKKIEAKLRERL